jgi:hypothetical protein
METGLTSTVSLFDSINLVAMLIATEVLPTLGLFEAMYILGIINLFSCEGKSSLNYIIYH